MKNKILIYGIIVVIILVGTFILLKDDSPGQYDDFSKCLTEKDIKFYGAYWCPHCKDQKTAFGNSFKFVNYIECSLPNNVGQTKECIDSGISGYPTWEFSNKERIEGFIPLETLSEKSGCTLQQE
jgi:hypothetical protein|tara:strand:+ start:434 stop:808 length:375 start_codon:yes stop_codon:yes gene_type:complete